LSLLENWGWVGRAECRMGGGQQARVTVPGAELPRAVYPRDVLEGKAPQQGLEEGMVGSGLIALCSWELGAKQFEKQMPLRG
jgi:hypothetical protein